MRKSRYTDSQILAILKQAEPGTPLPALCREHGMSSATFYKWRAKYGGMDTSGVCQASCPISYAANTTFLAKSLLSFDGFNQTSLTGFQLRTERFFQRSGLASLAVS